MVIFGRICINRYSKMRNATFEITHEGIIMLCVTYARREFVK